MAIVWIWVPIIGDGSPPTDDEMPKDRGPYRPDVPRGVRWWYDDSIVMDVTVPVKPPPAHTYCRIGVEEADLPKISSRVEESAVPESDRLLLRMVRECRRNAHFVPDYSYTVPPEAKSPDHEWPSVRVNGGRVYYRPAPFQSVTPEEIREADATGTLHRLCGGIEEKAQAFFEALPAPATSDRREMITSALRHARARGLPRAKADVIAARLGLAELSDGGLP